MARPAVAWLRAALPTARISVLCPQPLVSLYGSLEVDVIARPDAFWATVALVRGLSADAALLLAPSLRAGLEAALAGIGIRVGTPDDHRRLLLTRPVLRGGRVPPHRRMPAVEHRADEYLCAARSLVSILSPSESGPLPPTPASLPGIEPSLREEGWAAALETRLRPEPGTRLIGLNPSSRGGPTRDWPLTRWRALADALLGPALAESGAPLRLVILGGPEVAEGWQEALGPASDRRVFLAGSSAPTLLELAALLRRLDLLVTVDSGPMHLAAMLKTPLLVIYGSTLPSLTGPWRTSHRAIVRDRLECAGCYARRCPIHLRCLTSIQTEEVLREIERALSEFPQREVTPCTSW